ncbi:MAG: hypothetical protein HFE63_09035 [Clostridiales bacterium]|nr:hypothetical protein [Clostridiales bacterium]
MDFIFEFIATLALELGIEIAGDSKVSRWIKYPLFGILCLAFLFVLALTLYQKNIPAAIALCVMIVVGIFLAFIAKNAKARKR